MRDRDRAYRIEIQTIIKAADMYYILWGVARPDSIGLWPKQTRGTRRIDGREGQIYRLSLYISLSL